AYPQVPGSQLSTTYSMPVNGQSVPVQRYNGKSYAWFAFSGTANVKVTVSQNISSYTLSPKSYQIPSTISGRDLFFTLNQPRKMVLRKVNSLSEELFIFADPLESNPPILGSPGVVNVVDYGADSRGSNDSTAALQRAIDATTARAGGGIVYVPQGVYKITDTVYLKSNVNVYLAPGAVLQVPPFTPCCFEYSSVLVALDASNAKISGRGVVYGNGTQQSTFFNIITTENANNFQLEGIILLDGMTTALRFQDARYSGANNIKILSGSPNPSDGIDIVSSQNLTIDNCFVLSSDDSTAFGAGDDPRRTVKNDENITVRNSVFYQTNAGTAIKIIPFIAPRTSGTLRSTATMSSAY
ncbi:MAG: hypothetical protein C4293_07580, partial [Nitrospiraceae bacterium]